MADLRNWRSNFTKTGFLFPFFFGLVLSLWDLISDYLYAEENEDDRGFVYCFLCLPGLMLALTSMDSQLDKFGKRWCCSCYQQSPFSCPCPCCRAVRGVMKLLFLATITFGVFNAAMFFENALFILSFPCTLYFLSFKLIAVFVHTKRMKKRMAEMNVIESQYEKGCSDLALFVSDLGIFQKSWSKIHHKSYWKMWRKKMQKSWWQFLFDKSQ